MNDYDKNLDKNKANYVPLTPISFIERTKDIYPNYEALVYKKRSYTWKQVYDRSIKFASALEKHEINMLFKKFSLDVFRYSHESSDLSEKAIA